MEHAVAAADQESRAEGGHSIAERLTDVDRPQFLTVGETCAGDGTGGMHQQEVVVDKLRRRGEWTPRQISLPGLTILFDADEFALLQFDQQFIADDRRAGFPPAAKRQLGANGKIACLQQLEEVSRPFANHDRDKIASGSHGRNECSVQVRLSVLVECRLRPFLDGNSVQALLAISNHDRAVVAEDRRFIPGDPSPRGKLRLKG